MSNEQEITEAEKAYAIFAYWHDELGHDAPIVQQLYSDWQYARQRVEDLYAFVSEAEKAYAIFAYWHDELGHDAPIVQQLYSDWQYARQRVEDSKSSQGKNMNMNLAPAVVGCVVTDQNVWEMTR